MFSIAMKGLKYSIFALIVVMASMTSCDSKRDDSELYGMWQLTQWRNADGQVVATKEDEVYYSFQLQMVRFTRLTSPKVEIRALCERTEGMIRIYDPFVYLGNEHDSVVSMDTLRYVGVPRNGEMKVVSLSSGSLVLASEAADTLAFRKY